jgi:hypothetical protein
MEERTQPFTKQGQDWDGSDELLLEAKKKVLKNQIDLLSLKGTVSEELQENIKRTEHQIEELESKKNAYQERNTLIAERSPEESKISQRLPRADLSEMQQITMSYIEPSSEDKVKLKAFLDTAKKLTEFDVDLNPSVRAADILSEMARREDKVKELANLIDQQVKELAHLRELLSKLIGKK